MISKLTVIIISAIVITVLDSKCITEATQTTTEELNQNNQQVTFWQESELYTFFTRAVPLYVEYLAVIDAGVYNFFVNLYGSTVSPSVIKGYIQVYFTQLVNGVIYYS